MYIVVNIASRLINKNNHLVPLILPHIHPHSDVEFSYAPPLTGWFPQSGT